MKLQLLTAVAATMFAALHLSAAHPQILVSPDQRSDVLDKLDTQSWAGDAVEQMHARVDPYLAKLEKDPEYLTSRLAMNWDTHYTQDRTAKSRWIGGDGRAPVPTPRFAGARNWASPWSRPGSIDEFMPHNDQDGKVWLLKDGEGAWVDPGETGRTLEAINMDLMNLAADAGFLYWLTEDERYAQLAADLLWTYMEGFSHKLPPNITDNDEGSAKIIGLTSFEVIHEDIVTPMALAYDFVHDYMAAHDKYDVELVQQQFKRIIDRVIAGGFSEGNWNLNQARIIAYGGLALEADDAYPDDKGRPYYIDVVLNADLPTQAGITRAIQTVDPQSAMWPEAPGYGFGTVKDLVLMASLVGTSEEGAAFLADPLLGNAMIAQSQQLHPNGLSVGLGDTTQGGVNTVALELLIANARKRGDVELEQQLTAILQRETQLGHYERNKLRDLTALTKFVPELLELEDNVEFVTPTFYGEPLNLLMMRLGSDPKTALSAGMYGTKGGHVHTNGIALELYGAGYILGADPGRGSSYWEKDHGEYYREPPAHNTVIVNGDSRYAHHGPGQQALQVVAIEPQPETPPISDAVRFATVSFTYEAPVAAEQQRTVALIQLDDAVGFYVDIFRSRATGDSAGSGEFHDYLYHNIGQSLNVNAALTPSTVLQADELMPGYRWLKNERSASVQDVHATFTAEIGNDRPTMALWMPGEVDRTLFAVDAPQNRAIRDQLPKTFSEIPMPTVLLRQQGEAWSRPFIAVYEPFNAATNQPAVQDVAYVVQGDAVIVTVDAGAYRVVVVQDVDGSGVIEHDGLTFEGRFGMAVYHNDQLLDLYLGAGKTLRSGDHSLTEPGTWSAD